MNWQDARVLVTGAGGFIASHLTERLVAEGAHQRAPVRHNSCGEGLRQTIEWITAHLELYKPDQFAV